MFRTEQICHNQSKTNRLFEILSSTTRFFLRSSSLKIRGEWPLIYFLDKVQIGALYTRRLGKGRNLMTLLRTEISNLDHMSNIGSEGGQFTVLLLGEGRT